MDYNGLTVLANSAVDSDELGVGTFALKDNRDSKDYLVRRLADGNCWMVQNLDLELADFAGTHNLTSENTDLQDSGRAYWDPTEITNAKINGAVAAATGGMSPSANFNVSGNLTASTFVGLAKYLLGTTVDTTEQFQSYDLANGDHFWGTKCTATTTDGVITGTTCDTSLAASVITNTVLSEIPRSYSNMVTSDNSTDFSKATQFRYVPTSWETGQTRTQTMDATTGYPTAAPSAFGTGATDAVTSTATYIPTTKASSDTGNAGATYESAADGSFYGTMYVGHYYNWYAATAESGSFSSTKTYDASICPAGWRLPQNGDSSTDYSWSKLLQGTYGVINNEGTQTETSPQGTAYGPAADMHKLPLSIPFTGLYHWQLGILINLGAGGYFWSSTVGGTTGARYLDFYSPYVGPQHNDHKVSGFAIRCVNKGSNRETVVSTCAANSICYNSNGGSGSVETQTVEASETTATLASASALSRDGYVFAGWSTAPSGYGDIFGQNTETTVGDLTTSGLQLYAKWVKPELTMQGFTSARCSIMEENQKISLIDTRDSKIYGAIKLGDGECWMADDLAYTGSDGSYVTEYNDKIYYRANRFASKNPCPGGWSVPTKTQADAMLPYYENLSLSAVGGYYHGSIHNYEAAAFYWTSTPQTGGTLWYSISVRQTNVPIVSPGYGSDAGMFVRCIAQ